MVDMQKFIHILARNEQLTDLVKGAGLFSGNFIWGEGVALTYRGIF